MVNIRSFCSLLTLFLLGILHVQGQLPTKAIHHCASDHINGLHKRTSPGYIERLEKGEELIQRRLRSPLFLGSRMKYTIPVVVHVMHTGESVGSGSNISDAQISAAIDHANAMFRGDTGQGFGGPDVEIEFALAQRTPSCGSSNGIVRVDMSDNTAYVNNGVNLENSNGVNELVVKSRSVWSNLGYLNIWVVNKMDGQDGTAGSFVAGYAYFPGADASVDGVVILASQMATGNETLGHEMGHSLNLYHTFEGDNSGTTCPVNNDCSTDGDRVCDTDPHIRSSFTCQKNQTNACTGNLYGDVVSNHMDYSSCSERFTQGQKDRMRAAVEVLRPSLISSMGATPLPSSFVAADCVPTINPANVNNNFGMGPIKFKFNTIDTSNDSSFSSGSYTRDGTEYIDRYCFIGTEVEAGQSYPVEVFTEQNSQKVNIYIDFNNDGDFTDQDEAVFFSDASGRPQNHTGNIAIPALPIVANQPLRMRVLSDFTSGGNGPCGIIQYGQAEDYALIINFSGALVPTVIEPSKTSISTTTATLGANVSDDGGASITERGIVWSTTTNPEIGGASVTKITNGTASTGVFTQAVTGLPSGTLIYFRGYAINSVGTSYSDQDNFVTTSLSIPILSSPSSASITESTATLGATISNDGGSVITERGVVWSESANPEIGSNGATKVVEGNTGTGTFTVNTTGLPANTQVFFRGYAINSEGTGYTADGNFTTQAQILAPTITNPTSANITSNSADLGGEITSDGGASITERGIVWSTSTDPEIGQNGVTKVAEGNTSTGVFTTGVPGLPSNTQVFFRAYATNSVGTSYTNSQSFNTLANLDPPTIINPTVSGIGENVATLGGEISNDGGASITERGVVWSTNSDPEIGGAGTNKVAEGNTTTGVFSIQVTGLPASTLIYYRAYATNSQGTSYTTNQSFTTQTQLLAPTVVNPSVSSITENSALLGGDIMGDGGAAITERGIVYGPNPDPQIGQGGVAKLVEGNTGTGIFTISATGLAANTQFYFSAYAINTVGTSYSPDSSFTTLPDPIAPTVNSPTSSNITTNSATLGGTISSDGGSVITERGVVWSESANPEIGSNGATKVVEGNTGTGTFTVNTTGLPANTQVFFRGYAINSEGTGYTADGNFTTQAQILAPTIANPTSANITSNSADLGGEITSDGGASITERGIVWSTSADPEIGQNGVTKVAEGNTSTGVFTTGVPGLPSNTQVFFRAYATNSVGTSYTNSQSFNTLANLDPPTIINPTVSGIGENVATLGGEISNDGGASITERGVVWSTNSDPEIGGAGTNKVAEGNTTTGVFSIQVTGLPASTLIYYRAYATNSQGTSYTTNQSFTTQTQLLAPTVVNPSVSSITENSALLGGDIMSDGGAAITERGIVYGPNPDPQIGQGGVTKLVEGNTGTGIFTISATGLAANTQFYFSAYAINTVGTSYSPDSSFTTLPDPIAPTVNSPISSNITTNSATLGGTISSDGGASIIERGIVWSTDPNPEIGSAGVTKVVAAGTAVGVFSIFVNGLPSNSTIYLRAFATNSVGTGYSADASFNTLSTAIAPILTSLGFDTLYFDASLNNIADINAQLSSDGGAAVLERGFIYSQTNNIPQLGGANVNRSTVSGNGIGMFSTSLTLDNTIPGNTLFYYRAYAFNNVDTGYSEILSFNTLPEPTVPSLSNPVVSSISDTNARLGGEIVGSSSLPIIERGIVWSIIPNPSIGATDVTKVVAQGTAVDTFSVWVNNLPPNTLIYMRAYASNQIGTGYTADQSFTTLASLAIPSLANVSIINISSSSARLGGDVLSDGGASILERGFVWSILPDPFLGQGGVITVPDTIAGIGSYSIDVNLFPADATIYVKAYATNSIGTAYSGDTSFQTLPPSNIPTMTNPSITDITNTSATLGGEIVGDGGENITERGIVWSTGPQPRIDGVGVTKVVEGGSELGVFTVPVSNLPDTSMIYFRAYATNVLGTAYTNDTSFLTRKTPGIPTLDLPIAREISDSSSVLGGRVINDGGMPIIERGIVWSLVPNPTIGSIGTNQISGNGTSIDTFSVFVSPLPPDTRIYFRAYAQNSVGTGYTADSSINTLPVPTAPIIQSPSVAELANSSANLGAEIISDGGNPLVANGIVWSLRENPEIGGIGVNQVPDPNPSIGVFSLMTIGLPTNTLIHFRAYAINSVDTSYTSDSTFMTLPDPTIPTIINPTISSAVATSANLGAEVAEDGGLPITERGIVWSTSPNPLLGANGSQKVADTLNALGVFSIPVSDFPENIQIYFRGFASNDLGTAYTTDSSFTTGVNIFPPTISNPTAAVLSDTSATASAEVLSDGGSPILERGIIWSLDDDLIIGATGTSQVIDVGRTLGIFSLDLIGLPRASIIFYRGYAINAVDTAYSEVNFLQTLDSLSVPLLNNPSIANVGLTIANLGANVINNGGSEIIERGIVWSTNPNPVLEGSNVNKRTDGSSSLGEFALEITGLPFNETIYFRGFATNMQGTGYTKDTSFQTLAPGDTEIRGLSILVQPNGLRIRWEASETNNDIFMVERSIDTMLFEVVMEIDGFGPGTSGAFIAYDTLDQPPVQGPFCYRIKHVSTDGFQGYSDTVCATFDPLESVNAYPNPASSQITMDIPYLFTDKAEFIFADPTGRPILTREINGLKGQSTTIVIDTSTLPTGMYFGTVRDGEELYVKRLIIKQE